MSWGAPRNDGWGAPKNDGWGAPSGGQQRQVADDCREFATTWGRVEAEEWGAKGKMQGIPAVKAAAVGIAEGEQRLLLQAFDTEVKTGGFSGQEAPAVWGKSYNSEDLAAVDAGSGQEIFSCSNGAIALHWIPEAGGTAPAGVRITVRVSQYPDPLQREVLFSRDPLAHISTTVTADVPLVTPPLPVAEALSKAEDVTAEDFSNEILDDGNLIQELTALSKTTVPDPSEFSGNSPSLKLRFDDVSEPEVSHFGRSDPAAEVPPWTQQKVTSPKIIMLNPTGALQPPPTVSDFYMEFLNFSTGEWVKFANYDPVMKKKIRGATLRGRWGGVDNNSSTFQMPKGCSTMEFMIEGRHYIEGAVPYHEENKDRLHHAFLDVAGARASGTVRYRVTLVDIEGLTKSAEFSTGSLPLLKGPSCFAEAASMRRSEGYGFDEGDECLLWLHADNPVTLQRHFAVVSVAGEAGKAEHWNFISSSDKRTIESRVKKITPAGVYRAAWLATEGGKNPKDRILLDSATNVEIYAEFAPETPTVPYAVTAIVTVKARPGEDVLHRQSKTIPLNYAHLKQNQPVPRTVRPSEKMSW